MYRLHIVLRRTGPRSRIFVPNVEMDEHVNLSLPRAGLRFRVFNPSWEKLELAAGLWTSMTTYPGQHETNTLARLIKVDQLIAWANWQVRRICTPDQAVLRTPLGVHADHVSWMRELDLKEGGPLQNGAHQVGLAVAEVLSATLGQDVPNATAKPDVSQVKLILSPPSRRGYDI